MASKRKRTHTCKKRARTLRKVHRRRRSGGMLMLQALKSAFTKKELKKLMLVNAIYLKSMWIRTGNQENKRIYDAYNDAVVKTSAGRDSDISKDVTTETLTQYRTRLDGLYNAITDPTQKRLVDDDMINVQQLILDNPKEVNAKLRQFLHDIGNEDEVPTSASAAHPPPPHASLSSQWAPPPPHASLSSQWAQPPPFVASAPPMDDDSHPPPPSQYAPHMDDPQYGYFDIRGDPSIIPGIGRLRRI